MFMIIMCNFYYCQNRNKYYYIVIPLHYLSFNHFNLALSRHLSQRVKVVNLPQVHLFLYFPHFIGSAGVNVSISIKENSFITQK